MNYLKRVAIISLFTVVMRGGGRSISAAIFDATTTTTSVGPLTKFVKTIKESRRHLAAAAVARTVSIFGMYPVDTIKTRIQMEQSNPMRMAGLYGGVGGSLIGQVPYGVLTFGTYEVSKTSLSQRFPNLKPVILYALSAIMGDLMGSVWLCPSEVVKQQMQAGMYRNTVQAVNGIRNKRGWLGFYQGYLGAVARDVPFRVAQLTSYEISKDFYLRRMKKKHNHEKLELSTVESAMCGAVAGTFSAAITSPLDRIKTLLMTDSSGVYGGTFSSCAAKVWREEGVAGFCQGVIPRIVYIAPSVVIFFVAYEQVQQHLLPTSPNLK